MMEVDTEKDTFLERKKQIYTQYETVISYFIAELEVRDVEYPVEIFNEIRAIFTHLSRCELDEKYEDLKAAERHVKRAILDCYKYMCISFAEEIKKFREFYRKVDLSIAENGEFLPKLDKLENEAKKAFILAKKNEIKGDLPENKLYTMFEDAYQKYYNLSDYLDKSRDAILFASSRSKHSNIVNWISIFVTVVSIVLAIIGFTT